MEETQEGRYANRHTTINTTLEYITKKFNVNPALRSPITLNGTNRKIWAQTWQELGFTKGAEIGVADGKHSEILCQNNPSLRLYAIDPWDTYDGYIDYTKSRLDWFYNQAVQRLSAYNVQINRSQSMDAVHAFADGELDFVYIDGAHDFKSVAEDVCDWAHKVRIGGVVYGHDYYWRVDKPSNIIHVRHVIAAYTYSHLIKPWFALSAYRGADRTQQDRVQSWMFVRQDTDAI